jgi:hypothetical protein
MNMPVGRGAEGLVKAAGRNDRFAAATRQVRHRAAARLAEGGRKTSSLGQVETHDGTFPLKPSQRRSLHDQLARMRCSGGFSTTRAMAVQKVAERSLNLKRDLAAEATSTECRHSHLPVRFRPRPTIGPLRRASRKNSASMTGVADAAGARFVVERTRAGIVAVPRPIGRGGREFEYLAQQAGRQRR